MNSNWESKFEGWKNPSSTTEDEMCGNAQSVIQRAISNSTALSKHDIRVFAHGSYRNNTNVRQNSDVDIIVCCKDTFFPDFALSKGLTQADVGYSNATYFYDQFKSEVHQALVNQFGANGVTPGNKAFDVHANSYRVDADVVAAFEHRRYLRTNTYGGFSYDSGIEFRSSFDEQVVNWPDQHHANGVTKNNATNYGYKYLTRILKRLRYEMVDQGIAAASGISSYRVECMTYNVPDEGFRNSSYVADVRYILTHLYNGTKSPLGCQEWVEVNERKWLFQNQDQRRQAAFAWIGAAWNHIGFD